MSDLTGIFVPLSEEQKEYYVNSIFNIITIQMLMIIVMMTIEQIEVRRVVVSL